jgi:lysophospholipase L1-like esterase
MKRVLLLCCFLLGQTAFAGTPKLLIVGDSWASFMCVYSSFKRNLRKQGFATRIRGDRRSAIPERRRSRWKYHMQVDGCHKTTKLGTTTKDFLKDKWKNRVIDRVSDEDVKIVFISLGGNDVIDEWNANMPVDQEYELFEAVRNRMEQIIGYIKEVRPDVKIIISNYDYPNFERFSGIFNFSELYDQIGRPEPYRMNETLVRFASHLSQVNVYEDVEFIHHFGLMHYYYGNRDKGLARRSTAAPEDISPPSDPTLFGGDLEIESSHRAMTRVPVIYGDNYHLSGKGFYYLVKHTFDHYLSSWISETLDQ